ncbi:MAG: hypothetical protein WBA44_12390 [Mesorhizobium sp.]
MKCRAAVALGLAMGLAACQSKPAAVVPVQPGKSASLRAMEQVATAAHKCWIASGDQAFKPYRMSNELNSFSGQPRFLLVPARDIAGRPLLVVQARGRSSQVEVFGPLVDGAHGSRIRADIDRWSRGDSGCGTAA